MRSSKVDRNEVLQTAGDTAAGFKQGKRTLQATYDFAMQTHGSIGPSCAVADFKDGRLTVWTPSQASHLLQVQLATMLSLKPENVRCIFVEGAGCYGRNGADDCSSEAAVIAREIGKPVRLQWMRQDEHGWDPKGPPVVLDYRASIDDQGQITAWESDMFMPEQPFKRSGVTLLAAVLAGLPKMPFPGSATPHSGLGIPYALPNNKLTAHWLLDTPLPSAWIRAPGNTQNTFGNETLPRRNRGGHRCRSVRDPSSPSQGFARTRAPRAPARPREMGAARLAPARCRRHRARSRRDVLEIRERADLCGGGRRRDRRPHDGARSRSIACSSRTTAARSSIPTACAIRSKATSCRR